MNLLALDQNNITVEGLKPLKDLKNLVTLASN